MVVAFYRLGLIGIGIGFFNRKSELGWEWCSSVTSETTFTLPPSLMLPLFSYSYPIPSLSPICAVFRLGEMNQEFTAPQRRAMYVVVKHQIAEYSGVISLFMLRRGSIRDFLLFTYTYVVYLFIWSKL